jgi:hypothetical protein
MFAEIKSALRMRDVAERYGLSVTRGDMVRCPFHGEKTPSMKLYKDGFYCFACGTGGDIITFVARLYALSNREAAEKLNADFGLGLTDAPYDPKIALKRDLEAERVSENAEWFSSVYGHLCAVGRCLRRNIHDGTGHNAAKLSRVEYYIDMLMPMCAADITTQVKKEVNDFVRTIHSNA